MTQTSGYFLWMLWFFLFLFFCFDVWSSGWPLFLAAKLPGGFPLVRSGWREVHCRGSCGLGSASLVAYASALASVFQSVPNMGFGQPLSKEESKQIGRERKTTKERESEKVGCQIESPHLFFFSQRPTAKIMETFYFHSFWGRREEGGLRRGFSAHSVIVGIGGQPSTPSCAMNGENVAPAIYWCSVDLLRVVFMGKIDSLWPSKYKKISIIV